MRMRNTAATPSRRRVGRLEFQPWEERRFQAARGVSSAAWVVERSGDYAARSEVATPRGGGGAGARRARRRPDRTGAGARGSVSPGACAASRSTKPARWSRARFRPSTVSSGRPKSRRDRQRTSTTTSAGGGPGSVATRSSSARRRGRGSPAHASRAPRCAATLASASSPVRCAGVRMTETMPDRASSAVRRAHPPIPSRITLDSPEAQGEHPAISRHRHQHRAAERGDAPRQRAGSRQAFAAEPAAGRRGRPDREQRQDPDQDRRRVQPDRRQREADADRQDPAAVRPRPRRSAARRSAAGPTRDRQEDAVRGGRELDPEEHPIQPYPGGRIDGHDIATTARRAEGDLERAPLRRAANHRRPIPGVTFVMIGSSHAAGQRNPITIAAAMSTSS